MLSEHLAGFAIISLIIAQGMNRKEHAGSRS